MSKSSRRKLKPPAASEPEVQPQAPDLSTESTTPSTAAEPAPFADIVAESKQAVHEAGQVEPPKRPRGRQKGWRKDAGTPLPGAASATSASSAPGTPPPDVTEFLKVPLQAVSQIPARKYGIPELALSAEEAGLCAKALNDILTAFIPDIEKMSPKTAAVMGGVMVVGSIGFSKYQIYQEKRPATFETLHDKKLEEAKPDETQPLGPRIDAMQAYRQ